MPIFCITEMLSICGIIYILKSELLWGTASKNKRKHYRYDLSIMLSFMAEDILDESATHLI